MVDLLNPEVALALHKWRISGAVMADKDWKPQIEEPRAESRAAAPVTEPKKAEPPKFMTVGDRQKFWIALFCELNIEGFVLSVLEDVRDLQPRELIFLINMGFFRPPRELFHIAFTRSDHREILILF